MGEASIGGQPGYPRLSSGFPPGLEILTPGASSSMAGLGKAQASAFTPRSPGNFEAQLG